MLTRKKSGFLGITLVIILLASWLVYRHLAKPKLIQSTADFKPSADIEVVAENLEIPWEIAFLSDGEMLVTERPGRLLKIGQDRQVIPVAGVRSTGEGGLLGLALHPHFAANHWLYLYLTSQNGEKLTNRVLRYRLIDNQLLDQQVILDNLPASIYHDGGRIAFGPDGDLYITTGDAEHSTLAQDSSSLAGKILRLKDDGAIPSDNPFGNAVYSYGHRNSQGLAWDNQGRLWATEHGRSGILSGLDELNLIVKGANYGWPVIQGDEKKEGMRTPVINSGPDVTWAPAGAVYFNGSIFFTGLRGESLYEAKLAPDGSIISLKTYLQGQFGRLRAIQVGPDGFFYLSTSNTDGRGSSPPGDDKIIRLNPKVFGLEPNPVRKTAICLGQPADFNCYANYYRDLVAKSGVAAAFSDLRPRYAASQYVKSQCHPLTHVIGFAATKKFPSLSAAYQAGDSFCWSGYYHGVMEGLIDKIGYANLNGQLNGICAELAAQKRFSFDHYNCVHGLGHGIMAVSNDELFESLATCDVLIDSWERASCWSGVFMENIIHDQKYHFSKYLKRDDPLYPCDAVADQYKNTCYLMQTSQMLQVTGGDFSKVFALCGAAGVAYQDSCYQSLGRDASGRSVSDVNQTKATCDLGADFQQKSDCLIGAVKDFISYYHSDVQAQALCAAVSKDLEDICKTTAENYYKSF